MFGQQADLQIQIGASLSLLAHSVLADEHESRKKDRLQGYHHGQESVGKWVKNTHTQPADVKQDPSAKPYDVHVSENHASPEGGDGVGDAALQAALPRSLCAEMN